MVRILLCIAILVIHASAQQCNGPMQLSALYKSSFNKTYIEENSYLTQKTVASVVGAQCIAECVQGDTCLAAEWRLSEPTYCRHIYSDRLDQLVSVALMTEPDDKSTVTYNPGIYLKLFVSIKNVHGLSNVLKGLIYISKETVLLGNK